MKIPTPEEKQIKQKIDQLIAEKNAQLDKTKARYSRINEYAKSLLTTCNFHPTCKFVLVVFEDHEYVIEFSNKQHEVKEITHAAYLKALNDVPAPTTTKKRKTK